MKKLTLIRSEKSRVIDPYELYARYKGENWRIKKIDFIRYRLTIALRSKTLTLSFNEVEILEDFDQ